MTRPSIRVALGIVMDGDAVLVARRPADVPLGGYWEFPGGKLEPGESPEAAAMREVLEEVGIEVVPVGRLPAVTHPYDHATVTLQPIICRRTSGTPRPLQCSDCRWVLRQDLSQYAFPPANAELLAAVEAYALQDGLANGKLPPRAISSAG